MKSSRALPYLAISATAMIFGFSFLFTKNILDHLGVFQLLGYRFLLAALVLTLLRMLGVLQIRIPRENVRGLLAVALFQPLLYFVFETLGVHLTNASQSGVIISLVPISAMVFAVLILKERLVMTQWTAAMVSMAGVMVIVASQGQAGGESSPLGVLILLLAVVAAGMYNVMSRKMSAVSSPLETTYVMMWVGALVFNVVGLSLFTRSGTPAGYLAAIFRPEVLPNLFFLAVVSSIVAFFLFNYSLAHMEASRNAIFLNLVPIISVWAGVVFRGEAFAGLQILGMVLIIAGAWGINDRRIVARGELFLSRFRGKRPGPVQTIPRD